jgi:hypothetical protein
MSIPAFLTGCRSMTAAVRSSVAMRRERDDCRRSNDGVAVEACEERWVEPFGQRPQRQVRDLVAPVGERDTGVVIAAHEVEDLLDLYDPKPASLDARDFGLRGRGRARS